MVELPTGTITFLFTDIEGSTRMLQDLGDTWPEVIEHHHSLLRAAIRDAGGIDLRTEGDAFFAVFRTPAAAVAAATEAQRAIAGHDWPDGAEVRVRMGMHTGEGALGGDDYIGLDVHRAARIASAGHGGQVLISGATRALVEHDLPDGVTLRDLGAHRLKDLARPEHLHQLAIEGLMDEFPALRTLGTPTNLPAPRTSFVGRAREVAEVKERLRGPGLLTLSGPGGSGKTRLALQVARELLDDYPDGVFFVELGPVTDPRLIASVVAGALGVRAEGSHAILDTLNEHLRDREMLLVLDNLEQLIEGSPAVAAMLTASPRLRVLATSRELLHLAGEQELAVPPLSLPDPNGPPEAMERAEAVGLFVQRAATVDPGFRLTEENAGAVAELCRRLDGLPLAIELAASRIRMLPPQAILERLEHRLELLTGGPVDLPARQRTLREAIAWSHDLLDEAERTLFRRLAVFAGDWTLEAAKATAELEGDLREVLGSLVDKSLVTRESADAGTIRFRLLETIREFALERLDEAGETEVARERHAAFFLALAEEAESHLRALDQKRWLEALEREHDNLRAALGWAVETGRLELGMRLVSSLWRFWHLHAHLGEARRWAEAVLALPGADERTDLRRRTLTGFGGIAYWQEDIPTYRAAYEEAYAIAQELGDRLAETEGLYNLGFVSAHTGDVESAVARFGQAKAMYEELGVQRGVADCTWILGITARMQGDLSRSRGLAEEAVRLHRAGGDRFGMTVALYALGRIAIEQGDLALGRSCFLEALDLDESVGNQTGISVILDNLAAHASRQGEHLRALRLIAASTAIKETTGGQAPPPLIGVPDLREAARSALTDAAIDVAWHEGQAMTLEQAIAYAREVRPAAAG